MIDPVEIVLTLTNTSLSVLLCYIAYKIGKETGFVNLWKIVLAGFALGAFARLLITISATQHYGVATIQIRDTGLFLITASRVLLIVGFVLFLYAVPRGVKHDG